MTRRSPQSISLAESDDSVSSYEDDSVFDSDDDHTSDIDTNLSDASDVDLELDDAQCLPGGSDLPPEFFLRMQDNFKEEEADDTAYADGTTRQLDAIERRWNTYCKYTKQDPKYCMHHISLSERRENRCMTIEDLQRQAETTISTTKQRFHLGEHRIYALLFLLLIAPSGSRPRALLFLRFGDLELSLARDPLDGPHRILIRFRLRFTKTFLGEKETNVLTLPETIFDSSLLLSPHTLLLGLLFHHGAFDAPNLTSPEHLSKLDIHPDEHELPLPLKQSMNDIFVFRRATKTGMNAYVLSANEQITYNMISGWTKKLGELAGFGVVVILYTLRYNAGNEFDQCSNISDGLRNLMLQHANSRTFEKHYLGRVVPVDTMAVVSHKVQQKALMRQACSIGYSASKRRPTHLTVEQSASINDDPKIQDLLRQRDLLLSKRNKSDKVRTRLRKITKDIQSEKARLRRKRKEQVRKAWTREQAVTDIERQLAGKTFEEPPISPSDEDAHPAQKRLYEALTAPPTNTIDTEYRRRNNAILSVMSYCSVQEPPLPPITRYKAVTTEKDVSDLHDNTTKDTASSALGDAITSVFVKNRTERSRRCFLCVGRATTLQPSDPAVDGLIKPFYSTGDLSRHFKRRHLSNLQPNEKLYCRLCDETLDHKMHLQNHAETVHGTVSQGG
ncbi:C2H2 finger domain protein [Fusarium beomiforme]|uniref:C2H2 finger domain protein n=1 Tax=Fusarium beomiforme TaxID=44412 RepID=A0A9P5DLC5_9HYPO|nr:C2H2 finger domain protein [Fusarium beomiforme]